MTGARRVVFVVFDGMKMLDLAGPAEVFAEANLFGAAYSPAHVSPSGRPVATSTGLRLAVDGTARDVPDADTVVVTGGDALVTRPIDPELVAAVRTLAPRTRRLVSICTGSFVLAAAGVLAGRRATTHWRHAPLLARSYPDIRVAPDALYVEDGGIHTSAGVSAGIDLALALVEQDHGADLARSVARSLVMFMQRPGGQSQFSAPLEVRPPRTAALRAVVDLVSARPSLDHGASTLAARAGVSPRHLARLFAAELGTTPARYVEQVRLDHAKALLDAGHGVAETAREAGFGSAETLRRTFVSRLGVSPSQYRDRFGSTRPRPREDPGAAGEPTG
ncbi:GlxA family transcriptional regulator [Actinacidiphila rubida]|uniref:Transcriptional regulator, AraC family with amidase-like domain n=1 Tax=Actinacidiphila rubida TaxID=310780 RepID=A0A1H8RM84_9ACTN|nr:GlxA family transcriptional regulator [Actinacidiphila rubida]SEO67466.1 transcriptional regulator, AraC family with amidase-like domain [Actinacidiphila rubida]